LGIPKTKQIKKSIRSYKTSEVTCEWVHEIENLYPTNCDWSWGDVERGYKEYVNFLNEYQNHLDKMKVAKEAEEKQKQAKKKFDLFLASIILKDKLEDVSDVYSCMEAILSKDKYLRLAHWLARNRGDWSDGCSYAETGLSEFTVEDETDRKIYNCIYEYINNWGDHGDGRVFRDCEWNYDVLYGIAQKKNPEVFEDYRKLEELKISTRYDTY